MAAGGQLSRPKQHARTAVICEERTVAACLVGKPSRHGCSRLAITVMLRLTPPNGTRAATASTCNQGSAGLPPHLFIHPTFFINFSMSQTGKSVLFCAT